MRLILICLLLSGCTFVRYTSDEGAKATVVDICFSANAIELEVLRHPDGTTTLTAGREQESPDKTVRAVGDAAGSVLNPARGLIE